MSALDDARSALVGAAMEITPGTWTDTHLIRALCEAATTYTDAYRAAVSSRTPSSAPLAPRSRTDATGGGAVFPPYGRSKGQPVAGASRQDLDFYRAGCLRTLADPSKERFHAKERALLAVIEAELAR